MNSIDTERERLRSRWHGESRRVGLLISALQNGYDWRQFLGRFTADGRSFPPMFESCAEGEIGPVQSDLRGVQLHKVDLSGACLVGARFDYAQFLDVNMQGAILSSETEPGQLGKAEFLHCSLQNAQFAFARCSLAHFGHCDLSSANFANADLDSATFRSCRLVGAHIQGANFIDVNFVHSELAGLELSATTQIGARTRAPIVSVTNGKIRLHQEAENMVFDIFQFANQRDAFLNAAAVYDQLATAAMRAHLADALEFEKRALECRRIPAST